MHDTVRKVRKRVQDGQAPAAVVPVVSGRLQETGIPRALADPLAAYAESAMLESFRWLGLAARVAAGADPSARPTLLGDLIMSSRHLAIVFANLDPFLERVEDNLIDHEDTTHRENKYERDVAPFSKVAATAEFRTALEDMGIPPEIAMEAAQVEADLLKLIHLEGRLRESAPAPGDMSAMISEWRLDLRHHIGPAFGDGSRYLRALRAAAER